MISSCSGIYDIELNAGPRAPKYSCGVYQVSVTWKHKAICCDTLHLVPHKFVKAL